MILAPREFFRKRNKEEYPNIQDIYLCSIARLKEIFTQKETEDEKEVYELNLDSKFNQFDEIILKIENR
ncbi:MAG: hypothetical protein ACOCWW_02775 [Bacteroidota bacterium]